MATWRERFWPKVTRVRPSLRGLVPVERDSGCSVGTQSPYPWNQVMRGNDGWRYLNTSSRPEKLNDARVRLKTSSSYEDTIARRAQARWFRNRLGTSPFTATDQYPRAGPIAHMATLCMTLLGFIGWKTRYIAPRLRRNEVFGLMPLEYQLLAIAPLIIILLGELALLTLAFTMLVTLLSKPSPRTAEFGASGMQITGTDGGSIWVAWKDVTCLKILCGYIRMRFGANECICFLAFRPMTWVILGEVRNRFLPHEAKTVQRRLKAMPRRVMTYCVIGAVTGAALLARYGLPDRDIGAGIALVLLMPVLGALIAAYLRWGHRINRWEYRRCRTRAEARRRT